MDRFIKLFILICIYMATFSTISFAGFEDINGHWCEEQINNFLESNFLQGYEDGSFRPDNEITKAEFCKIVNSYMSYEVSGEWQEANMKIASEKGYLIANANAEDFISREEAFVALSRVMKLDEVNFDLPYEDSGDISVWAVPAIKSLSFMKYVNGYKSNEIRPNQNITRAEVVAVLYEYIGIGGLDEEIENMEFTVGYLSHNDYGLEYIEIEEEIEILSGDIITMAATVSNEEDVVFEIISGDELVDFDEETLSVEAIASGEVKISAKIENEKKVVTIKIK